MGKQQALPIDSQPQGKLEPYDVPQPKEHDPDPFMPYPEERSLEAGDEITLIHRTGRVKKVRFARVIAGRGWIVWPVANEVLSFGLRNGRLYGRMKEWRVEPNVIPAARKLR